MSTKMRTKMSTKMRTERSYRPLSEASQREVDIATTRLLAPDPEVARLVERAIDVRPDAFGLDVLANAFVAEGQISPELIRRLRGFLALVDRGRVDAAGAEFIDVCPDCSSWERLSCDGCGECVDGCMCGSGRTYQTQLAHREGCRRAVFRAERRTVGLEAFRAIYGLRVRARLKFIVLLDRFVECPT